MIVVVFLLTLVGLVVAAPVTSVQISEQSYYTAPAIAGHDQWAEDQNGLPVSDAGQVPVSTTEDAQAALQEAVAEWEARQAQSGIPGQGSGNSGGEEEAEVRPPGEYPPETEAPVQVPNRRIIFMGDSRMVALYCSQVYDANGYAKNMYVDISKLDYTGFAGNSVFVAKAGEGIYWLEGVATGLAEPYIDANTVIVLWFGVNDTSLYPSIINDYLYEVNNVLLSYGVPVYYMEIGPCNGANEGKNPAINSFNSALNQWLDPAVRILPVNEFIRSRLETGEFATLDGLHYNYNTSRGIFQYVYDIVMSAP